MGLNIKSPEAHHLAQKLSKITGESLTTVVTDALREQLARKEKKGLAERLLKIGEDMASRMSEETRTMNLDDYLYDENGLPK